MRGGFLFVLWPALLLAQSCTGGGSTSSQAQTFSDASCNPITQAGTKFKAPCPPSRPKPPPPSGSYE